METADAIAKGETLELVLLRAGVGGDEGEGDARRTPVSSPQLAMRPAGLASAYASSRWLSPRGVTKSVRPDRGNGLTRRPYRRGVDVRDHPVSVRSALRMGWHQGSEKHEVVGPNFPDVEPRRSDNAVSLLFIEPQGPRGVLVGRPPRAHPARATTGGRRRLPTPGRDGRRRAVVPPKLSRPAAAPAMRRRAGAAPRHASPRGPHRSMW